jgi:hypothetical protein
MLSQYLLPETVARQDGTGTEIALERGSTSVLLTLGVTRIMEQESLEVSIWGSPDGEIWRPLGSFPQKFYCGTYSMVLDLSRHPEIAYLRAQWKMGSWGGTARLLFGFYLLAEDVRVQHVGAA